MGVIGRIKNTKQAELKQEGIRMARINTMKTNLEMIRNSI